MCCKRNLTTNEITKYKARLNVHGGKQTYGVNYFDTYAPVVTWFAIRLVIIFAIVFNWSIKQVDFVMAYSQAPIENDLYMDLPVGIHTKHGSAKDFVLKLTANLYGQKQAGRVWNQYLVEKLTSLGFQQSLVDECVFYRGTTIFICYVDDGLVLDMNQSNLSKFVKELRDVDLDVDDQGHPADYVGVNISKLKDGSYSFTQRALIDSIIEDVGLSNSRKVKPVPAKVSQVLHAFPNSPKFDQSFNYRSAVGKLNYVAQTTRPDIMAATHIILMILARSMAKPSCISPCTSTALATSDSSSSLIHPKDSRTIVMPISQAIGMDDLQNPTQAQPSLAQVGLSSTRVAQSSGPPSCRVRSPCLPLRRSTSRYLSPYAM